MTFSAPSSPPPGRHNKAVIMNAARRAGRCRNHTGKSESLSCLSLSHIVLPWAPAAAAQDLACGRTGRLAVVVFDLPIDDREVDAFRQLIRFDKGGVVDDRCRIKDGNVREVAGLQEAAAFEVLALRRKRGDLAKGRFEGHKVPVANVVSQKTRHGAESAGMRVRFVGGSVK